MANACDKSELVLLRCADCWVVMRGSEGDGTRIICDVIYLCPYLCPVSFDSVLL